MASITINGNKYSGNNIVITNGKILINGKDVNPESKEIRIIVEGNVDEIKIDYCNGISVNGNVNKIDTTSGYVIVTGEVTGNVQTTSGDIECNNIGGSVSTISGDIKHRV